MRAGAVARHAVDATTGARGRRLGRSRGRYLPQLLARGFNTTQGKTAALYDLLMYLDEETKSFAVDLPDGTRHETTVYFMREFVSHG
jgi:hypothetical protein